MSNLKYWTQEDFPLEMHKVRIVQKLNLLPVEKRVEAITAAGNNTFLLNNCDVFLDMLTDSGVNAMSDRQQASMNIADDAYAGSATFTRLKDKVAEIFGMDYFLPAHQGRACENVLSVALVKEGDVVPMNYHFTTVKSHITRNGGMIEEVLSDAALSPTSDLSFKGNVDIQKLRGVIEKYGADKIPFVRIEAGTNLIGGQPVSLQNMRDVKKVCDEYGIMYLMDASLLQDNLYFNKLREPECANMSIREITRAICDLFDVIYFSARKLGFARGGGICVRNEETYLKLRELIPLFEGFLTYGGMSVREMEAIAVGLDETMDEEVINQGPKFIEFMCNELIKHGVPVVTPPGGLGCHLNASAFLPNVPQEQYPSGALACAVYIAGGIRGMERGTLSEQRNPDGSERLSDMELLRLALPRRVFTLSQVKYAVDRVVWLYENRDLVEGLVFTEEPEILRFFVGRLKPVSDWQQKLTEQFRKDFGDSL